MELHCRRQPKQKAVVLQKSENNNPFRVKSPWDMRSPDLKGLLVRCPETGMASCPTSLHGNVSQVRGVVRTKMDYNSLFFTMFCRNCGFCRGSQHCAVFARTKNVHKTTMCHTIMECVFPSGLILQKCALSTVLCRRACCDMMGFFCCDCSDSGKQQ